MDEKGDIMGALKAYVEMLLDGRAFSNWENKPSQDTRNRLVEVMFLGKKQYNPEFRSRIEKIIKETTDEHELKRMLDDMQISEDEFLV